MVYDRSAVFLDSKSDVKTEEKIFVKQYNVRRNGGKTYLALRMAVSPHFGNMNNRYLTDNRRGVHLTLAVRFNENTLSSIDKDVKNALLNPQKTLMDELLDKCAKEFIPDYYNYILDLTEKFKSRAK